MSKVANLKQDAEYLNQLIATITPQTGRVYKAIRPLSVAELDKITLIISHINEMVNDPLWKYLDK